MKNPILSNSNLKFVSHNFQNIYVAAHIVNDQPIELVPSLIGDDLYCPQVDWRGRLIRLIYRIIECFCGTGYLQKRLSRAIEKTKQCFLELEKNRTAFHDIVYQNYLNAKFNQLESQYKPGEIQQARAQLTKFYQAVYPFVKLVRSKKLEKLNHFFEQNFLTETNKCFFDDSSYKRLKYLSMMVALEGIASENLPFHVFIEDKKDQLEINENQANSLSEFIKTMVRAKKEDCFNVDLFHRAMKCLVKFLKKYEIDTDILHLEKSLIQEGCLFLNEFDNKHVQWRNSLKNFQKSSSNAFTFINEENRRFHFVLGEELVGVPKEANYHSVFEMHDKTTNEKLNDYVMVIGPNKAEVMLLDLMRLEGFWGLEMPDLVYLHPQGKYGIFKRPELSVDMIDWSSKHVGQIDLGDRIYADSLKILIQFFIDQENSPKDLNLKYLRFENQILKTTKSFIPSGKIDYLNLEQLIFEASKKNNLAIYCYLIAPLINADFCINQLQPFFKSCIKNAFKGHPLPIKTLGLMQHIEDENIISRGVKLFRQSQALKEECRKNIMERYVGVDDKKLRKHMGLSLIRLYEEDQTLGRFWECMTVDDLIEEVETDVRKIY